MPRRAKVFTPTDQEIAENDPEARSVGNLGSSFFFSCPALHCPAAKYKKRMEKKEKKAGRQRFNVHHSGFLGLYRSKMTRFQLSPRLSSTDARPGPNVGCCSCMHSSEAQIVVFLLGRRQTPRLDIFSNHFAKVSPASQQPACFRIINFSGALSCIFVPASGSRGPVGS